MTIQHKPTIKISFSLKLLAVPCYNFLDSLHNLLLYFLFLRTTSPIVPMQTPEIPSLRISVVHTVGFVKCLIQQCKFTGHSKRGVTEFKEVNVLAYTQSKFKKTAKGVGWK